MQVDAERMCPYMVRVDLVTIFTSLIGTSPGEAYCWWTLLWSTTCSCSPKPTSCCIPKWGVRLCVQNERKENVWQQSHWILLDQPAKVDRWSGDQSPTYSNLCSQSTMMNINWSKNFHGTQPLWFLRFRRPSVDNKYLWKLEWVNL